MDKENKRQVWRARAFVKVLIYYDEHKAEGYSEDIGEGGLKIESLDSLPLNENVIIEIPVISPEKVTGIILDKDSAAGTNIYRIQFININKSYKNKLLKYILDKIQR